MADLRVNVTYKPEHSDKSENSIAIRMKCDNLVGGFFADSKTPGSDCISALREISTRKSIGDVKFGDRVQKECPEVISIVYSALKVLREEK